MDSMSWRESAMWQLHQSRHADEALVTEDRDLGRVTAFGPVQQRDDRGGREVPVPARLASDCAVDRLATRYSLFAKSAIEPCLDPLGQRLQLLGGVVGPHLLGTASRESRLRPGSGPPAATRASAVRPARQRAMVQQKYGHLCPGFAGACGMGALKVWHALRRQRQPYAYHSAAKKWHALPSRTSRCQTKCEYRMRSSKRNTTAPSV